MIKFYVIIIIMFLTASLGIAQQNKSVNCNLFLDEQPIVNFEKSFGKSISSYFLLKTIKSHEESFDMVLKDNDSRPLELLIELNHEGHKINKIYELYYRMSGQLMELRERVVNGRDELFNDFDLLIYKFNDNGFVSSIYGYKTSFFGLITMSKLLKVYEYDNQNKIKSIWDFRNPDNNIINHKEDLVAK